MKRLAVTDEWDGSRIDRFIRAHFPRLSFPAVQTMLRKGAARLNGDRVKGSARLASGDTVSIETWGDGGQPEAGAGLAPDEAHVQSDPLAVERLAWRFGRIGKGIDILHEDDDLLVIDKPSGLLVQPGNRPELGSLLDLLADYRERRRTRPEGARTDAPVFNYTPVHRLDGPASGALAVAKTRRAARALGEAFAAGGVEKAYLVAVTGIPELLEGIIDESIAVTKGMRSRAEIDPSGKPAITSYRTLQRRGGSALLEVEIGTGRTHQIRAHLASIGHPVVGDTEYGESTPKRGARLMLHSWKLGLVHPVSRGQLTVKAPPPPEFGLDVE